MKAWEEHASDLYILTNDILNNQLAQEHGYKSMFYYVFNPRLAFVRNETDYIGQIKLLRLLEQRHALTFTIEEPPNNLPKEFLSKNAQRFSGPMIKLKIAAVEFNRSLTNYQKYKPVPPEVPPRASGSAKFDALTGILTVRNFAIKFRPNSHMHDMLRMILKNRESRRQVWCEGESTIMHLGSSSHDDPAAFFRNTGNNINKRIAKDSNKVILNFLEVTTTSVRLNKEFV